MCKKACPLNCGGALILSTGFLLLNTGYYSAQNLASKILSDNDFGELGFYSVGVAYLSFAAFSLFSAPIVRKLGDKCSLIVGSFCYVGYIASFILPLKRSEFPKDRVLQEMKGFIYVLILLMAMLCGAGSSLIWVAGGKYISECANEQN
jgi:MFS family permease